MGDNDVLFKDMPGLPAVEHAKKRIQERKAKDKATREANVTRFAKIFYTVVDGKKIIMITVKPNGMYRSYFDSVKKLGPDLLAAKIKKWKSQGQWMDQYEIEDKGHDLIVKMQDEQAKG